MLFLKLEFISERSDFLIFKLEEIPFNGFEETYDGFNAYIKKEDFTIGHQKTIESLREIIPFDMKIIEVPDQNWNAIWESEFKQVRIDDFCEIRADFHPPSDGVDFEIVINPKMAFGTGHHETTESMIRQMKKLDFKSKRVFDYGCGTGILAILAEKLGAKSIFANDIEREAVENSKENIEANTCQKIQVELGDIHVSSNIYEIILANINRNVLINTMKGIFERLEQGGYLICSGVLERDEEKLFQSLNDNNLSIIDKVENKGWLCILAQK